MYHQSSPISHALLWTQCSLQNSVNGLPLHARFATNILREKLMALVSWFVDESCGSHADDILSIMIDARR
jgi:hypothetical protein